MRAWNGEEWVEVTGCLSHGDGLHEYGTCIKDAGHDDEHEDEEGYRWN